MIHQECNGGEKYWNLIDQRLALVRKLAESIPARAVRCVSSLSSAAITHLQSIYMQGLQGYPQD